MNAPARDIRTAGRMRSDARGWAMDARRRPRAQALRKREPSLVANTLLVLLWLIAMLSTSLLAWYWTSDAVQAALTWIRSGATP